MTATKCHLCGQPVDPAARTTYRMVCGWERRAETRASGAKGGSDIRLREPVPDMFAHSACVDLTKAHINVGQGSLI